MGFEQRRMAETVEYWRAVELFSPPKLPKVPGTTGRVSAREWVQQIDLVPGQPRPLLPWEAGHPLQRERIDDSKEVWRHTVYGGVFPLALIRRTLEEHFGADQEDHGRARDKGGDSAVFAFTLDDQGVLCGTDTVVFSTCAWATGRILDPGPQDPEWLDGFEEVQKECRASIAVLTSQDIPYVADSPPAAPPISPPLLPSPSAPAFPPGLSGAATAPAASGSDWRGLVREILGGAAVGALGALIGDMGAGIVAGALTPVVRRALRGRNASGPTQFQPPAPQHSSVQPAQPATSDAPAAVVDSSSAASSEEDAAEFEGRPVVLLDVVAFAAHVADLCGVGDLVSPRRLRIHSTRVRRRKNGTLPDAEPAFLNSFLPEDLLRVVDAQVGGYGTALRSYLTDPAALPRAQRVDLRQHPETVLSAVAPAAFPLGRWPAPTGEPLALSQQFAVNRMVAELMTDTGLFSVNGPPGTGKTTMLRDLIAAIIVERARVLVGLQQPEDAFGEPVSWLRDSGRGSVRPPEQAVTGFEMVVASTNNGAVQNITMELPALDALGSEWHAEASYFVDQAVALLKGTPAWGAVAAPLGKGEKRKDFMEDYWWGEKPKTDKAARPSPRQRKDRGGQSRQAPAEESKGMQSLLQRLAQGEALHDPDAAQRFSRAEGDGPPGIPPVQARSVDWAAARQRFRQAVAEAERLVAERQRVAEVLAAPDRAAQVEELAQDDWRAAWRSYSDALTVREQAAQRRSAAVEAAAMARNRLQVHRDRRPGGVFGSLGAGREYREWQSNDNLYQQQAEQAQIEAAATGLRLTQTEVALQSALADNELAEQAARAAELHRSATEELLRQGLAEWPDHVPADWEELSEEDRELAAPWSDPVLCAARTRVFLAAMDLHRAFVAGAADIVRRNLLNLKEAFAGALPPVPALAVWQTLFLVVPVVSTTFASCGRLFSALGRESLGWVLVDEAGQATPQAAVGALWRARRAVLVGDPLQLEPVVELPASVQELLRATYQVDESWMPSRTSAQRVADRVNRWGTTVNFRLADGDVEQVWVGAPLRVHRRCENPMFDLSNDIAYDGLMVYGTRTKLFPGPDYCDECKQQSGEGCRNCSYPPSCWIDIAAVPPSGKWVPEEGVALTRMIEALHDRWGIGLDRIRVISPFRDVVAESIRVLREAHLERIIVSGVDMGVHDKQVETFLREQIGTVHTMQGKEADVVILVLGTHPTSVEGQGQRTWAAQTANLLNVAASRAKRRLFVIGNREQWGREQYFSTLADPDYLPARTWSPPVAQPQEPPPPPVLLPPPPAPVILPPGDGEALPSRPNEPSAPSHPPGSSGPQAPSGRGAWPVPRSRPQPLDG